MNAQLAFEVLPSDPRAVIARPKARRSDGVTAHAAAKRMESGNGPLMRAILTEAARLNWVNDLPASAFTIAVGVQRNNHDAETGEPRWQFDSIRSAVSRAPFLTHVDNEGVHRGRSVRRWRLKDSL